MDYYTEDNRDVRMVPYRKDRKEAAHAVCVVRTVKVQEAELYVTWCVQAGCEYGVDRGGESPEDERGARDVQGALCGVPGQNMLAQQRHGHEETGIHIRMEGYYHIAAGDHDLQDDLVSPIDRMADEGHRGKEMRHVVQRSGYRHYMKVPMKNCARILGEGHVLQAANIDAPGAHAHNLPHIHRRNQRSPGRLVNDVAVPDGSNSRVLV